MNATTATAETDIDRAEQLPAEARDALRSLILVLADTKRLLGIRYSDWMLGAPTIEAGIAASSMAQDEWGHGRLTYALLSDFGDDPKRIEHERDAAEYRSIESLDRPLRSWNELIAASLIIDTALYVQYGALLNSRYAPIHNRVQKLLDEEKFHFQYAAGWSRRLASAEAARGEFRQALDRLIPAALRWLGRQDAPETEALLREGIMHEGPDALRGRFLGRVAPILTRDGLAEPLGIVGGEGGWSCSRNLDWDGWDDASRRAGGGGPDAETLARVRGDKNRALLLD